MIINIVIILIVLYIIYRFSTSFIIPKIQERRLNNFKDKFKKDNPNIFKDKKEDNNNTENK